jgi:hypothetical protein
LLVLLALLLLLSTPISGADAIVMRHDRDDQRYRDLARGMDLVCRIGDGMGTLVAPQWVLTAAHVAEALPAGGSVRFGTREIRVSEKFIHPDYADTDRHRDLALLHLDTPVETITPAVLQTRPDELGRTVTFVGDGDSGTGRTGPQRGPRVLRAAHNTVQSVRPGWLTFTFDAPPDGDDLEGISGPGDSGGPALLRVDDRWHILGVSAYNDGAPPCTYGTTEHYSRVADERDWIDTVMRGDVTPGGPRLMRYGKNEQGQTTAQREPIVVLDLPQEANVRVWDTVAALTDALNEGDRTAYVSVFRPERLEQKRRQGDPLEGIVDFMQQVKRKRGPIVTFHALGTEGMELEESAYPLRAVTFHLQDGTPGYMGLAIDEQGRIDHLSFFVQDGLCAAGASCTRTLPLEKARRAPAGR